MANSHNKNWHQKHLEHSTFPDKLSDLLAQIMGSWGFIIIQSVAIACWVGANIYGYVHHWDPYPFILLNLLFSVQAAYSAPIIMMAQNRQNDRDREHAAADFKTNVEAKKEIEELQLALHRIEEDKLDKILKALTRAKK